MDTFSTEDGIPNGGLSLGPPALIHSMLDFGRVPRGGHKTLQQVIANTNRQPVIWLADAGEAHWLILEPDRGVLQPGEQQSIRVTANTASLAVGEHSVTLTFSSEGDEASMSNNTVSKISVENAHQPTAALPQVGLDFGELTPPSTRTLGLLISNPTDSPANWRIDIGSGGGVKETLEHEEAPTGTRENIDLIAKGGVSLSSPSGTLHPHESQTIRVTARADNLEVGHSYTTTLTLTSETPNAAPTSVQVPVRFYATTNKRPLYDGGPKVPEDLPPTLHMSIPQSKAGPSANLGAASPAVNGQSSLDFTNPDENAQVKWELQSDESWLTTDRMSGTLAKGAQEHVIVTANSAALSSGAYTATLKLIFNHDPSTDHATEKEIPVTVVVQ